MSCTFAALRQLIQREVSKLQSFLDGARDLFAEGLGVISQQVAPEGRRPSEGLDKLFWAKRAGSADPSKVGSADCLHFHGLS
jgi:hypothetical protein